MSYLAFVPAHTPSRHRVLAIVDRGDGAEADAVATFPDASSATSLAAALNGILQQRVTAERHLASVLQGVPDAVGAAVRALLPTLAAAREDPTALRVVRELPIAGDGGVRLFPTTNCPDLCETCGTCRDDCTDCEECADGGCEICLPVTVTPRTAVLLAHALAVLADEVYDCVYRTGVGRDGAPGPLGAVPDCVAGQDDWFLRRYARAFDDLNADLQAGRYPTPTCTAEEIALDMAIEDAERIYQDETELVAELVAGFPVSRFDYDWDALQDALFQDKDYEGLLDVSTALSADDAERWFDDFSNVAPRYRRRGFRR
jgi:hypothetical protein